MSRHRRQQRKRARQEKVFAYSCYLGCYVSVALIDFETKPSRLWRVRR